MNLFVRKCVFLILNFIVLCSFPVLSQDEYKAEIGIQAGANAYTGDVNTIARKKQFLTGLTIIQPDFGAFLRYRFNTRTALRLGYDKSSVNGVYEYMDGVSTQSISLNNPLRMIDLTGEYNFFDLENNPFKRFSKKYSPYIYAGLGYMNMPNSETGTSSMTIPFGFGLKVKLAKRWNFNAQWSNHLLLGDNLEGKIEFDNPNPKTGFNPMNNDLLSGITLGISYDFWKRACNCNENTGKKSKVAKSKRLSTPSRVKNK